LVILAELSDRRFRFPTWSLYKPCNAERTLHWCGRKNGRLRCSAV